MVTNWIARNGQPCITLVTSIDASEQEKYAAQELKNYLDLITTASIPLKTVHDESISESIIAVGKAAHKLGVIAGDLGIDDFILQSSGKSLAITGGKRGVIYGVYEFLEKLGCRFFTPACEKIPSQTDLELPVLREKQSPAFEYRYHNYKDFTGYPRFAVKNRINGPVPIKEKFGGNMSYVWFVHSFNNILDPEEWFEKHPEYFSMVDGKRIKERTQLCLTNPDVLKLTIEKVKSALRERPECRLISVSQNDWYNNCTCQECQEIDELEGSNAGSLIRFVNQVAEAIEPEFPEIIIDTLAYQYSRPAPKYVRPRKNVCVRLCSIEACFAHPFETCDDSTRQVKRPNGTSSDFIHDLQDWAKVCDRIYIWDYTTCFAHYPAPFPNWNVLQPNIKAYAKNNVKGVFEQACGAKGGGADLNELRAYLIAKLLWNPDCDLEQHEKDFLGFYYGAAGDQISEYITVLTDKAEQDNIHVGFNDETNKGYLTDEMLDIYNEIFNRAERAVHGDPIRAMRVAKARLSIRWVRIKNDAMLKGIKIPEVINRFFEDWRAHEMTRIDEWVSAETTHRALIEGRWRGTEFYKNWWDEGVEEL